MGAKVPKKASSQAGKQKQTDRQAGRQASIWFRFVFTSFTHTHKQTHNRERRQFSRTTAFPLAGGDVLFELLLPAAGHKVPRKGSMVNLETHFPTFTVPPVHTNWERFSLLLRALLLLLLLSGRGCFDSGISGASAADLKNEKISANSRTPNAKLTARVLLRSRTSKLRLKTMQIRTDKSEFYAET